MSSFRVFCRAVAFLVVLHAFLSAQTSSRTDPCAMPSFSQIVKEKNIFSEEQEEWLGEIVDQGFRREFHVIEDLEGRVQQIGERLLAQLPPTRIHYRFTVVDSPELNSFGFAGGRIYIFRRLIAFAEDEDELAALLGHEIGHIATHQLAIDVTRLFEDLGITEIGDKQDLLSKWQKLRDNRARIHERGGESREQKEQLIADRIALYAMARAGYDPAKAVTFFDRVFLTKGKTGGFWSDFLSHTRPENIRLREIARNAAPLPPQCVAGPPPTAASFPRWREAMIAAGRAVTREQVPGLINKTVLQPPLRGDLENTRFSPDGKYILAQDESSIFVLTREPLANVFRIDAPEAFQAQFTPDSHSIVFYDREFRVQKWEIETRQRTSIHELNITRCWGSGLSPTGDVLACARPRLEIEDPIFELQLIDVATGQPFFTREKFYELSYWERYELYLLMRIEEGRGRTEFNPLNPSLFNTRFSPDGRYVIVARGTNALAYDLANRTEIKVPYSFKEAIVSSFAFIAPDQIAGFNISNGKVARITFPAGHISEDFVLAKRPVMLRSPGKGDLVVAHSGDALPAGILDLREKKVVLGFKAVAFDVYDPFFAGEENTGQVVLGKLGEKDAVGKIELPESPLGSARTAVFSSNGKWLAVSGNSRGAIWNLEKGERVFHTSQFDGAFFDANDQLVLKFPRRKKIPSQVFKFDLSSKATSQLYELPTAPGEEELDENPTKQPKHSPPSIYQRGDLLFTVTRRSENWYNHDYLLEVKDIHTNNLLWERKFGKEHPYFTHNSGDKTVILVIGEPGNMKDAVKDDPDLRTRFDNLDAKKDAYVIQVVDAATGKPVGGVIVDTGKLSFKVKGAVQAGDTIVVADSTNRTLVYSLKSRQQVGKVFGHLRAVASNGEKMLVENGDGVADIYDTSTMQSVSHLSFPARIITGMFSQDGNIIHILTADQRVYRLSASGTEKTAAVQ